MSEHEQITLEMYSTLTAQQLERIQELEQRNRELTRQVEQYRTPSSAPTDDRAGTGRDET